MLGELTKKCKMCQGNGKLKSNTWELYYINLVRYDFGDLVDFDPDDRPRVPKFIECTKCRGTGRRLTNSGRYFANFMGDSLKKIAPREDITN